MLLSIKQKRYLQDRFDMVKKGIVFPCNPNDMATVLEERLSLCSIIKPVRHNNIVMVNDLTGRTALIVVFKEDGAYFKKLKESNPIFWDGLGLTLIVINETAPEDYDSNDSDFYSDSDDSDYDSNDSDDSDDSDDSEYDSDY